MTKNTIPGITRYLLFVIATCAALPGGFAYADDWANDDGHPHFYLRSKGEIIPASVHVLMDDGTVSIKYVLQNKSPKQEDIHIRIEAPLYGWRGAGDIHFDGSYADMQLLVNDVAVKYDAARFAYYNKKDITRTLEKYKIDPNSIPTFWSDEPDAEKEAKYQPLLKIGILDKSGLPAWETQNIYTYDFTVREGEQFAVTYTYEMLWGSGYFSRNDSVAASLLKAFELTWEQMCQLAGKSYPNGGLDTYFTLSWTDIPLWPEDWKNGLDNVVIELSPSKDANEIILLDHNGKIFTGRQKFLKEIPHMELSKQVPSLLVINPPADG